MSKNFTKEPIFQASKQAREFAFRILNLLNADRDLENSRKRVPSYTAQHSREDYIKDEYEHWNYCAELLFNCVKSANVPNIELIHQKPEYDIDPNVKGHQWNREGERCLKCGAKDWMGGPCNDEPSDISCNSDIPVQNGTT